MEWLKNNIDKLVHLLICTCGVVTLAKFIPLWIAVVIMIVIALGKEGYDKADYGVWSWGDLLFDAFGIGYGILLVLF